jgi:hypothetical protein
MYYQISVHITHTYCCVSKLSKFGAYLYSRVHNNTFLSLRFTSYLLRKPHLFVILTAIGWFIVNIQSDLFWHRCLERQTFGTPRMYTRLWKLPKSTSKKPNIYNILLINMTQSCQIKQRYTFHLHPAFIE